jgi:hypothetical protein
LAALLSTYAHLIDEYADASAPSLTTSFAEARSQVGVSKVRQSPR